MQVRLLSTSLLIMKAHSMLIDVLHVELTQCKEGHVTLAIALHYDLISINA